ncbi:septum site determining protein [Streptomyces viridochromogenes DSM 40736]|uniref:Septum site determining protein n=1 Tax=Streptomyces viridochromogenes (strain DSM 40736 / JCM 4977 / BCRC 1201 / Tue 494) TaxID=591159 RepID=D9X3X4_STRVT|nr:septum site determining protein [Streptomyces viridochromogenes DSM 40736]
MGVIAAEAGPEASRSALRARRHLRAGRDCAPSSWTPIRWVAGSTYSSEGKRPTDCAGRVRVLPWAGRRRGPGRSRCPELHSLRVLSWDRGDRIAVPPQAVRAVLAAARRRGGTVVVDLPRRIDDGVAEVLTQLDIGVLVVPAELRAVAAAGRVASAVGMVLRDLRVAVRGPYPPGLDEREVARLLGLPLVGEVPVEPGLLRPDEDTAPPGAVPRGPLARFCKEFWERSLVEAGAA